MQFSTLAPLKQFAAKIPELEFSPAEILSFLTEHRISPQEAIDNTGAWMARLTTVVRVHGAGRWYEGHCHDLLGHGMI